MPGCGDIALFRTGPWLVEVLALTQIHQVLYYFPQKIMFYYQTFFLLQICSLLDYSWQIPEKKISGVTELVPSQTAVKGGNGIEIAVRIDNLRGWDWCEMQNSAHRVSSKLSRSSLCSVVFMCLISVTLSARYDILISYIQGLFFLS